VTGLVDALGTASAWAVPLLVAGIPLYALTRKVKVYPVFLEGAAEGFQTGVRVIPPLVAVMVALGLLRASGALDLLAGALAPVLGPLGVPAPVLPLALIRPLSGGGALGVVADVLKTEGPDSYAGRLASVMAGSTETTFYVLAVYFGAAGVRKYRHALPAALLADLAGMAAAVVMVRWLLGGP
jgi:spore maturation protein B